MNRLLISAIAMGVISIAGATLAQPVQTLKVRDFTQLPGATEYAKCGAEALDVTMTCEAENAHLLNCRVSGGKGGSEASTQAFCAMKWVQVKPKIEGTVKFPLRGESPMAQSAPDPKAMSVPIVEP